MSRNVLARVLLWGGGAVLLLCAAVPAAALAKRYGEMIELELTAQRQYANPFADVRVEAVFTAPSGKQRTALGFYDGGQTWRVRFRPDETGRWRWRAASQPEDPGLCTAGELTVARLSDKPRFLLATPGVGWGFCYSTGEPCFLLGETFYNIFGVAYCAKSLDEAVAPLLRRRAEQGFNIFRARCQVSPQHPKSPKNVWQTRPLWPWGGTRQNPQLDRLNLEWFRTVDKVLRLAESLDVGFEMILEAWGFEFPFNNRKVFTEELERLWLGYCVARWDAFASVYVWTLMNEYEYYPDGKFSYNKEADEWALRTARWLKSIAPHGHIVAVHNGPRKPPFAQRFAADPGAIDAIMFQEWGSTGKDNAWLAAGLEENAAESLAGWPGSAMLVEYGYERSLEVDCLPPWHQYLFVDHTRRGAWRGAFCGLCVGNGFAFTWGPYFIADHDMPGVAQLALVKKFFVQVMPFAALRPAPELVAPANYPVGGKPLCLADKQRFEVAVYLPVGGAVKLNLPRGRQYNAYWFDPRTGELRPARGSPEQGFSAPRGAGEHPEDWVLVLTQRTLR